ncbi:MAG: DNA methyltransferase, partial [Burkholderiales bacterium]
MAKSSEIEAFIRRWEKKGGTERANYQLFLTELCKLLELPQPDPARDDTRDNAYVFERRVVFQHGDGSESSGFIDLYRRGSFVLEAKKVRKGEGKGFDDAMLRARGQAEQYARALPAPEGRPPFVVVADVGNVIELYAEFTRSGATYTPYPDPQSHRVSLADLRTEEVRERLRQVWTDPMALDPSRRSAKATREIAGQLADIASALERAGHAPEVVAGFLTRCLFSMFAEDVGLLPKRAFVDLLDKYREDAATLGRMLSALWQEMDSGGFSAAIAADVLRFNGKIFKDHTVLPLDRDQIDLLLKAARSNWREVEPAIFGTLFERALNPEERHKLGAHYTPRAYVERLVLPTIVEPLRDDWKNAQGAALLLANEGKVSDAIKTLHEFHGKLCNVRVLDPACGSGNFLYVTLEHLKRLEGEVINQLAALGDTQQRFEGAGGTVDPHQLLGIEVNPRAAAITELVLWIGYLQWHFRTHGQVMPPQPVLKDFRNIECRDALLTWDRIDYVTDERGVPITRWNGKTYKKSPVTGEDVPDESAQVPVERYVNPKKANWPKADFVIGNPPFLGKGKVRDALGDGYVGALRETWAEMPDSVDLVMYWWNACALLARTRNIRRFGLITTNSIRQAFNRRVLEVHMSAEASIALVFAVPDHPWVDSADGAAVRIAMTVG